VEKERNISCPHAGNGSKDSYILISLITINLIGQKHPKSVLGLEAWLK
jgi:hypothetical protein